MARVAGQGGALSVAALADDQQMTVRCHSAHGDDLVFVQQPNPPDTSGGPGAGSQPGDGEFDRLTLLGDHDHVFGFAHLGYRDQLIALLKVENNQPGGANAGEFTSFKSFDLTLLGRQQQRVFVSGIVNQEHGLDRLSPVQGEQVGQQNAPAGAG